MKKLLITIMIVLISLTSCSSASTTENTNEVTVERTYQIVGTNQTQAYNNKSEIETPNKGEDFYGQNANYLGNTPNYQDNGDGTVTDLVTGLMWQQTSDQNGDGVINYEDKMSQTEAEDGAKSFDLAGYSDWRLPTIKEMYSLIMFNGLDVSGYEGSTVGLTPFINTEYFDYGYGDEDAGERVIDSQFATTTIYTATTMDGNGTMFGVNLADGRIKGYPTGPMPGSSEDKQFYVMYVRGNSSYGVNNYTLNNDSTITDNATGLMWMQNDSESGMTWQEALEYAENLEYGGYTDWRLPDAKELQSIVDYSKSPEATNSPAIDAKFTCSEIINEAGERDYPAYWTSTTHANMMSGSSGAAAAYVCFGRAMGNMFGEWMDVHGAGAQRSDPKVGDPDDYPTGNGPQGDAIRIYNYVRLVRNVK